MENITGYYVELQDENDTITAVNEEIINKTATAYAATSSADIVNGGEEYYPDLEWPASAAIESVEVNGNPVEVMPLIGGLHPPQRPK